MNPKWVWDRGLNDCGVDWHARKDSQAPPDPYVNGIAPAPYGQFGAAPAPVAKDDDDKVTGYTPQEVKEEGFWEIDDNDWVKKAVENDETDRKTHAPHSQASSSAGAPVSSGVSEAAPEPLQHALQSQAYSSVGVPLPGNASQPAGAPEQDGSDDEIEDAVRRGVLIRF